jgi:hypothetical protein
MLLLDPIEYVDGWPVVRAGNGPTTEAINAPVIQARDGANALGN